MRTFIVIFAMIASTVVATAQQRQALALSGERAEIDSDLAKISMPREAHAAVFSVMQFYERKAQEARGQPQTFTSPVPVDPK